MMNKYWMPALKLSIVLLLLCSLFYSLLIAAAARLAKGNGDGEQVYYKGKAVGYRLIGQEFRDDRYFQGRPSAVHYNAAGSGGSNKGPADSLYLQTVKARIDSFLVHNPSVHRNELPAELVTASGSGLDPDISPAAALVQVKRIAISRQVPEARLRGLIAEHTQKPLLGFMGPETINVLELNIALDAGAATNQNQH